MIYWLCLICCIQSSYYASPLIRTKHELYNSNTRHRDSGLHGGFRLSHFDDSLKRARSLIEPWLKSNPKEREAGQNSKAILKHRYSIRTPNSNRKFDTKREKSQNSAKVTKSAAPEIKPYNPNVDSSSTQNQTDAKQKNSQPSINNPNDNEAETDSKTNAGGPTDLGSPNQRDQYGQNTDSEEGQADDQRSAMPENIDQNGPHEEEQTPEAMGGVSKGHRKKTHKKKHNKPSHSNPSFENDQTPYIPQPGRGKISSDNESMSNEESNPSGEVENQGGQGIPKDNQVVQPVEINIINPPKTQGSFGPNDIIDDQQSSNNPTDERFNEGDMDQDYNPPAEDMNSGEQEVPSEDQNNQPDESDEQGNFVQNDIPEYYQSSDSSANINESPENENLSNDDSSNTYKQDTESTTEENAEDFTEMYKPIRFKLEEGSQSFIESKPNDIKTDDQRSSEDVAIRDINTISNASEVNDKSSHVLRNDRNSFMTNETFLTTLSSASTTEDSKDDTPNQRKFQKKSNIPEYFNKFSMETKADSPYSNLKKAQEILYKKRSDQFMKSSTPSTILTMRNYKRRTISLDIGNVSKRESHTDNVQFQSKNNMNLRSLMNLMNKPDESDENENLTSDESITITTETQDSTVNILSQKENTSNSNGPLENNSQRPDGEITPSTSIMQEYAMPTLGIPNKIMKGLSENQRRSSHQNRDSNFETLHSNPMHIRNKKYSPLLYEKKHIDNHETLARSSDLKEWKSEHSFNSKSSRNTEDNYSTQGPVQKPSDKFQYDQMVSNTPVNDVALSKRSDHESNIKDKMSRVYEESKTKQTIVKDSKSNKVTDVVEKQNEMIVDNINLSEEEKPKPSSEDSEETNQSSAAESESDDEASYPNEYENGDSYDDNIATASKKKSGYEVSDSQGQSESFEKPDANKSMPIEDGNDDKESDQGGSAADKEKTFYTPSKDDDDEESTESDMDYPQATEDYFNDDDGNFISKKDTWETDASSDSPSSALNVTIKRISNSNSATTNTIDKPPEERDDYLDETKSKGDSRNMNEADSHLSAPNVQSQPMPYNFQYSNDYENIAENGDKNSETDNMDDSSNDEPNAESETNKSSQSQEFQNSKGIPEQSTDDFIDLAEQEVKKDRVLGELNKFPTARLPSKSKTSEYQSDFRDQKESQRSFYEFSTILPNAGDIGEFQREEKVERQSKVVVKNNGVVRNGTSCLFGEKKMEIKDNKQSYHEAYMEEKGENKFPNEQSKESEKQKRSNLSETLIKARQTPDRVFPRQRNTENGPSWSSNSNLMKPWDQERGEDQRVQPAKSRKNAHYINDDAYDEYYYATEDNPESMLDPDDEQQEDEYDEYAVDPKDILDNDGRIDSISKRSGAFMDVSKLIRNGKMLRSSEMPSRTAEGHQSDIPHMRDLTDSGESNDTTSESPSIDELSSGNREEKIRTSNGLRVKSSNPPGEPGGSSSERNFSNQRSIGSHTSNRQLDGHNSIQKHTSSGISGHLYKDRALFREAMEHRRDDYLGDTSTRTVNTGSGNIVYVTEPSTTDKNSKLLDFLQIQEVGGQTRRSQRQPAAVYRRQKKQSPERKITPPLLRNYRHSNHNWNLKS